MNTLGVSIRFQLNNNTTNQCTPEHGSYACILRTTTADGIIDEFGGDVEVSRNIGAGMISHWKAHVTYGWHITIVLMACINLAESCAFGRVQHVRDAHQPQKRFILC